MGTLLLGIIREEGSQDLERENNGYGVEVSALLSSERVRSIKQK